MDNLTVQFLQNAAKILKKSKSSENINNVINQLRLKSLDFAACSPNEINPSEVCMHCGNVWEDGLFSLHVKSHKNKKIKKQIRRVDHITTLSPCRKAFLSYYKSQKDNILIKKCSVCKSITKNSMNKPFNKKNKENVKLQVVENNTSIRKRKRKSGKKQSFAGLSPAAVLQARSSSCHTKIEDLSLQSNSVPKICEPTDISKLVKNTSLLSPKLQNLDNTTPSKTDLSLSICEGNRKKQKLKNGCITANTNKSSKNKRKSFLSEVLSFL